LPASTLFPAGRVAQSSAPASRRLIESRRVLPTITAILGMTLAPDRAYLYFTEQP
jgi:hypothetical protein